jgi:hypothetical protein
MKTRSLESMMSDGQSQPYISCRRSGTVSKRARGRSSRLPQKSVPENLTFTQGDKSVFSIDFNSCCHVLALAFAYGWQMAMTDPPPGWAEEDWSGTYVSGSGQHVRSSDARSISVALERFLLYPETIVFEDMFHPDLKSWAPKHRDLIKEMIRFCRGGGFRID